MYFFAHLFYSCKKKTIFAINTIFSEMDYYILIKNEKKGPFALEELPKHGLSRNSMIWSSNFEQWKYAKDIPELQEILNSLPPDPPRPVMPKNWLVESILVTCLCCIPFGLIGIINSVKVDENYRNGNYQLAERHAADAKKWCVWGFFAALVSVFMYGVVIIAVAVFGYVLESYN